MTGVALELARYLGVSDWPRADDEIEEPCVAPPPRRAFERPRVSRVWRGCDAPTPSRLKRAAEEDGGPAASRRRTRGGAVADASFEDAAATTPPPTDDEDAPMPPPAADDDTADDENAPMPPPAADDDDDDDVSSVEYLAIVAGGTPPGVVVDPGLRAAVAIEARRLAELSAAGSASAEGRAFEPGAIAPGQILVRPFPDGDAEVVAEDAVVDAADADHDAEDGAAAAEDALRAIMSLGEPKRGPTSRYFGVHWDRRLGNWKAQLREKNGHMTHVCCDADEEKAARAYNAAVRARGLQNCRSINEEVGGVLQFKDSSRGATSEWYGVSWHRYGWVAQVTRSKRAGYDGALMQLGYFRTERKAAEAVDAYIYQHCPKIAFKANFPRPAAAGGVA